MTRAELQQWCDNVICDDDPPDDGYDPVRAHEILARALAADEPQRRGFLTTFGQLLCIVIGVPLLLALPGIAVDAYAGPLAAVATVLVLAVALLALLISGPHDAAPRSRRRS
jgi:hypothetical protein